MYLWTSITLQVEELWPSHKYCRAARKPNVELNGLALQDRSFVWYVHTSSLVEAIKFFFPNSHHCWFFLNILKSTNILGNYDLYRYANIEMSFISYLVIVLLGVMFSSITGAIYCCGICSHNNFTIIDVIYDRPVIYPCSTLNLKRYKNKYKNNNIHPYLIELHPESLEPCLVKTSLHPKLE